MKFEINDYLQIATNLHDISALAGFENVDDCNEYLTVVIWWVVEVALFCK